MRRQRTIPILIAVTLVVAGCNANNAADTTAVEPGTTPVETSTPDDGELLPEGTYRSGEVTRDELVATGVAAGFSAEEAEAFLDDVDELQDYVEISHRLEDGEWTSTVSFDTGIEDEPARGPYEVVDENTVVAPGFCGPVTLGYAIDGDSLTFEVIEDQCDEIDQFFHVLNFELAPFIRVVDATGGGAELIFSNPYNSHRPVLGGPEYAAKVEELSGGSIRFRLTGNAREGDPENEEKMIEEVRDGDIDLAMIAPRVFAKLGAERLAALAPPMLIDSYVLEREVFEAGLANRLVDDLDDLGLVAVAVIPGPLQWPVGFDRTFSDLDDFAGAVFTTELDELPVDTLAALGATPHLDRFVFDQPPGNRFPGIDGMLTSAGSIMGRQLQVEAEAATGNLNLFAVPFVIIANRDMFESLDASQQAALRNAGPSIVDDIITARVSGQAELVEELCDLGFEFVTATDEALADVRTALEPVYDDLTADPEVAAYVEEVEQLKAELGVGPDSVTCPATASIPGDDEPLPEGLYRTREVTRDEMSATAVAAGFDRANCRGSPRRLGLRGHQGVRVAAGRRRVDPARK
jgi:TRAP-type C4-dicarboxylate transport system substrate-binding protein